MGVIMGIMDIPGQSVLVSMGINEGLQADMLNSYGY